jgi:hypothetical protein
MARRIPPFGEGVSDRRLQRFAAGGGRDLLSMFRLIVQLLRILLQLHVNLRLDELLYVEVFWMAHRVLRKREPFVRRIFQAPLQGLAVKETPA